MQTRLLLSDDAAVTALSDLYRSRGYSRFKMSKFEEYDFYVRNKSFLVSENIITFTDTNGKLMALKPDVTLSIVKSVRDGEGVRRLYYNENVYRPAAGGGTFREIMHMGLECIGDVDDWCLAEVLTLACESLARLSEDYVLDVSDLDLLSCAIALLGLDEDTERELLRFIAEKNTHDLSALCASKGANEEKTAKLVALLRADGSVDEGLAALRAFSDDASWTDKLSRLTAILNVLPRDRVRLDFSVVNDMRYYNGIVFQGFIRGIPNFVLSGGQYDRLMASMGKTSRAVGFAVYLAELERYASSLPEYDVDTILLYDDTTPLSSVAETVRGLNAQGSSVCAVRKIPEKTRCRRILKLTESGVELC